MKKNFQLLVLFLLLSAACFSQQKFALNAGYDKVGKHTGYLGAEYRINSNEGENKHGPLTIGIGSYMYGENGRFAAAPELHLNKTWNHFLITEISTSTKNIRPSLGLSFFNLTRLQFGYSFPIDHSSFKGFYVGFHILIGGKSFYDEITLF